MYKIFESIDYYSRKNSRSILESKGNYHIVINPNGTSPFEYRHSLCWYTKGHIRIEVCQNTIDGHDLGCIYLWTSLPYYFSKCWVAYTTILITTRISTWLFPLTTRVLYATIYIATRVHQRTQVSFKQLACHTRVAYINSRIHLSLTLKYIYNVIIWD